MTRTRPLCLLLWITATCSLAVARQAAAGPAQGAPEPQRYTLPLAELMVRHEPIMLRGASGEYRLSLPLAARMDVEEAMLELRFVNSISLLDHRSQLAVFLNDAAIAQVPLRGKQPEGHLKVRLPVDRLRSGYNSLHFRVVQHYSESCEDPASQELWTQIDTLRSALSLKARLRPLPATLAQLDTLFDQRLWGTYRLQIVTAGDKPTEDELLWGALVSQGVALRLNYLPFEAVHRAPHPPGEGDRARAPAQGFPVLGEGPPQGHDTVLIGTRDALAPRLPEALARRIEGAFLGVYPDPRGPGRYILVVSGRSPQEVTRAATAFSFPQVEFADSPDTLIETLALPEPRAYMAKNVVREGHGYRFSDLGLSTVTQGGLFPPAQEITFWVPPDLFVPSETASMALHLHLAYSAGLGPLSTLNIHLNGAFQQAIHMDQRDGAVFYDYVIRIPMRSLRPGRNTLSFSPYLMPAQRAGACEPPYVDGLLMTLFDDSYIRFARAAHYATLPDLALFTGAAFPYGISPDGARTAVVVASPHSEAVSATWTLLAKLSQITGGPFTRARIGYALPQAERHMIVVGLEQDLDARLRRASPLAVADQIRARVAVDNAAPVRPQEPGILGSLLAALRPTWAADATRPGEELLLSMSGVYSEHIAMAQFESPIHPSRSVVTVTAARPEMLQRGVYALTKPALWGTLGGSYVLWRPGQEGVHRETLGPHFELGERGLQLRLMYRFSRHPWIWSATVLGLLVLMAMIVRFQLIRYRRRHHGPED